MSEQFAMQPDEFDSTNTALDSILDRLNSLGESAASMKVAPLRPLQSVPELDPNAPLLVSGVEPVPEAPNLGLVPPIVTAVPAQAPTPPAPAAPQALAPTTESSPVVELSTLPEVPTLPDVPTLLERTPAPAYLVAEAPTVVVPPVAVDPAPVSVEHHELELLPVEQSVEAPIEPISVFDQNDAMETAAVFELDAETLEAEASLDAAVADVPESPTSIFSSGLSAPADEGTLMPETDGWVSYHDDEDTVVAFQPEADLLADETVESIAPQESLDDFFAGLEASDESVNVAGIDPAFDTESFDAESLDAEMFSTEITPVDDVAAGQTFETDEDLELPDFTGVFNDTVTGDGFWGDSEEAVPESVDGGIGQVSARRDEFDKLRPADDDVSEVLEKESVDLSIKLQMIGVIIVGILALLAVWLKDPGVVADMRASVESLFG